MVIRMLCEIRPLYNVFLKFSSTRRGRHSKGFKFHLLCLRETCDRNEEKKNRACTFTNFLGFYSFYSYVSSLLFYSGVTLGFQTSSSHANHGYTNVTLFQQRNYTEVLLKMIIYLVLASL